MNWKELNHDFYFFLYINFANFERNSVDSLARCNNHLGGFTPKSLTWVKIPTNFENVSNLDFRRCSSRRYLLHSIGHCRGSRQINQFGISTTGILEVVNVDIRVSLHLIKKGSIPLSDRNG